MNVLLFGGEWIKAGIGVSDTNQSPSVVIRAEVGKTENKQNFENLVKGTQIKQQCHNNISDTTWCGRIRNHMNFMAIIDRRHVILKELNIKRARNECSVLITVPNTLVTLYGIGCLSGLVIDVGYGKTAIADQDFDEYFLSILLPDTQFFNETPDIELARTLKESDICEVLSDVDSIEDRPDRIEAEYNGRKAIYRAISYCEPDKRTTLWVNIAFTGSSSLLK
ncbi:3484_t:CDS:2, partial [Cetraspora pellucida]